MYKSNSTYFSAYLTTNLLTSNSRAQSTSRNINDDFSSEKVQKKHPDSVFTQINKSMSSISNKQKENDKKIKMLSSTPESSKNFKLEYFKGLDKLSRCEQLFRLGQARHQLKKQAEQLRKQAEEQLKAEELKECTFQPKLISKQTKNEERKISPARRPQEKDLNDKVNNQKLNELREKSFQRAVQRAREAQKEKELIQKCLQRGEQIQNMKKLQSQQEPKKKENQNAQQKIIEQNKDLESVRVPDKTNERIQRLYELSERYKIKKPKQSEDKNQKEQKKEEAVSSKVEEQELKKPLLFVDIDIGEDQKDRITVYTGDSPEQLAKDFCSKHGFDEETQQILQEQLQQKIQKVLNIEQDLPIEKEQTQNHYQNTNEKYRLGGQLQLIPESICNEDEEEDEDEQIFNQALDFDEETRTNHLDETSKDKSSEISQIQEIQQESFLDNSPDTQIKKKKHNFIDRIQEKKDVLFEKQLQERSLKLRLENSS